MPGFTYTGENENEYSSYFIQDALSSANSDGMSFAATVYEAPFGLF